MTMQNIREQLEIMMITEEWEACQEKVRSMFTTVCIMEDLETDTAVVDGYLLSIYNKANISELDIEFDDFYNYMVALIV